MVFGRGHDWIGSVHLHGEGRLQKSYETDSENAGLSQRRQNK